MLGELTAWEWNDPALQKLHFVIVATFNLQHPARFEAEAVSALREVYVQHLDTGLPVSEIRRAHRRAHGGARRVLKPGGAGDPVLRSWPATIADVYGAGPPGAADRVVAWSNAVRSLL